MRGFRIAIVKMPVLWKDYWFEDLAVATGAKIADPVAGLPLKNMTLDDLGTVENIVITKEDTFLDGIKDVSSHVKALEEDGTEDSTLRATRLNTKTARYYVGAQSDSALAYRRLKVEDAISSAYQALNGGIVPGGGIALLNVTTVLPTTVGGLILKEALKAPVKQIALNAGKQFDIEGFMSDSKRKKTHGLNSKNGEIVNMFEAGIVDPKNVVLNAVKNAISVSATVLTAPTIVLLPREEVKQEQPSIIKN
jgi:chaperonin GroEL